MNESNKRQILDLLKDSLICTGQDDFGLSFESKNGLYRASLTSSTFTATSKTDPDQTFSCGSNPKEIGAFVRRPFQFATTPNFMGTKTAAAPKGAKKGAKPTETPAGSATPPEGAGQPAATKSAKIKKAKVEGEVKKRSVRSIIFEMIKAKAPDEKILEALKAHAPEREEKSLKSQLSLNKSEYRKQQEKAGAAAGGEVEK